MTRAFSWDAYQPTAPVRDLFVFVGFRRVVCAACGEEDPSQLSYFQTDEFEHVRIEACGSCKHYIKDVDLTRLGFAEPLVDDVATAALDLWAIEHGYTKIELNLVGI